MRKLNSYPHPPSNLLLTIYSLHHVIACHHVTWTNSEHSSPVLITGRLHADYSYGITGVDQVINKLDPDTSTLHTSKSHQSDVICYRLSPKFLGELVQGIFVYMRKRRQVCGESRFQRTLTSGGEAAIRNLLL